MHCAVQSSRSAEFKSFGHSDTKFFSKKLHWLPGAKIVSTNVFFYRFLYKKRSKMAKNVLNVENNLFDKCTVGNRKNRLQSIVLVPRDCNVQLNSGFNCIPPEEDAIALKACEIHVSKFVNLREFCPMQQKTIPVENYANMYI